MPRRLRGRLSPTVRIRVSIARTDYQQLDRLATDRGTTVSALLRLALAESPSVALACQALEARENLPTPPVLAAPHHPPTHPAATRSHQHARDHALATTRHAPAPPTEATAALLARARPNGARITTHRRATACAAMSDASTAVAPATPPATPAET